MYLKRYAYDIVRFYKFDFLWILITTNFIKLFQLRYYKMINKRVPTYFCSRVSQNQYICDVQHLITVDGEEDKTAASFVLDNTRQP